MANVFKFTDMVWREAQIYAHEKTSFIGSVDRQYDESFSGKGGKHGSTLRVKKPNMYTRTQGSRAMNVQDVLEETQTITVATQDHVDIELTGADMALNTSSPSEVAAFSREKILPAMAGLMSGIEADFLAYATKATANCVGTAGTAITSLLVPGQARARLNQYLAPKDGNRSIQMDSLTMAGLVNGVAAYFAPQGDIAKQYREGMVARTAMADYYENERIWTLTNSSDVTGTLNAAAGVVDGVGAVNMYSTIATAAQTVGAVFTMAGIYACHPETKAPYSFLQSFTITAAGTASGLTSISPALYLSGPRQNVCTSTGAKLLPGDFGTAQTLVFQGNASTSYIQPLMYHRDAFQFITADLPDMGEGCTRKVQDGISLRVWMDGDIRNDSMLMRIDLLYGLAALRTEWACRMIGS